MKAMLRAVKTQVLSVLAFLIGLSSSLACTLRLRCVWVRILRTMGDVVLRLLPSLYDAQDAHKQQYASGQVRNRRQRDELCTSLQAAERAGTSPAEAAFQLGLSESQPGPLDDSLSRAVFADVAADVREVAVHYSGGADSTLAAIMAAQRFETVHLLTFCHPFIRERERSEVNAEKLTRIFGSDVIVHRFVDATDALDDIMFGDYLRDLRKYGTFLTADPCLACKLSFDTEAIRYACENDIRLVVDGSDLRVPFQLSQGHEGMLELRRQFYLEYGIDFRHPVGGLQDTTDELFLFGLRSTPACMIYAHQPGCIGNDLLGAIYKRFYFLPRYGMEGLTSFANKWAPEKIAACKQLLSARDIQTPARTLSAPDDSPAPAPGR